MQMENVSTQFLCFPDNLAGGKKNPWYTMLMVTHIINPDAILYFITLAIGHDQGDLIARRNKGTALFHEYSCIIAIMDRSKVDYFHCSGGLGMRF